MVWLLARARGRANRLPVARNAYFQFGDLRVDFPQMHVVVEVESAGGLTNLVKFWQCISHGSIDRPIHLVHCFRQVSADDYRSHIELWNFMSEKMKSELGPLFHCALFTYTSPIEASLRPALDHFEGLIERGAA